jgi:hemoglobin
MTQNEWVFHIVDSFYAKAKDDVLIGYHFRVVKNFEEHIPRISAFWEMQLFHKTDRAYGAPFDVFQIHLPMKIKRGELGRWLVLFKKTLEDSGEFPELKVEWLKKLDFFEEKFLRFFSF